MGLPCQHFLGTCFLDCDWKRTLWDFYYIVGSCLPTCKKEEKTTIFFNSFKSDEINYVEYCL